MTSRNIEKIYIPNEIHEELLAMEWLSGILPIQIGSGKYIKITLRCPYCNASINMGMQKGNVNRTEHSVAISGYGACHECKSLAPFQVRLRNDGSILFRQEHGWVEQKVSIFEKLRILFRLIMGGRNEA